jgi:hypothetical protein
VQDSSSCSNRITYVNVWLGSSLPMGYLTSSGCAGMLVHAWVQKKAHTPGADNWPALLLFTLSHAASGPKHAALRTLHKDFFVRHQCLIEHTCKVCDGTDLC